VALTLGLTAQLPTHDEIQEWGGAPDPEGAESRERQGVFEQSFERLAGNDAQWNNEEWQATDSESTHAEQQPPSTAAHGLG
jgi:hypothetical protein